MKLYLSLYSTLIVILLSGNLFSQSNGDGYNDLILTTYDKDVEVARNSITMVPGFNTIGHTNFRAYINSDLPLNGGVPVTEGDFNHNFIRVFQPIKNNATQSIPVHMGPVHHGLDYDKWSETTTYYDGLGRPMQEVQSKQSPGGADVIHPIVYDNFGRVKQEYLSYAITQDGNNGPGGFRPDATNEIKEYYTVFQPGQQDYAFADKQFDNSPLNRVMKQGSPGEVWNLETGATINYSYLSNAANEVALFEVEQNGALSKNNYYEANSLFKNDVTDENNHTTVEYKNKQGQVILKVTDNNRLNLKTYYVYDDYGLLRYVIPPEASDLLESQNGTIGTATDNQTLKDFCFYYKYDNRKRLIEKKIPGAELVYIVYNKRDQVVLAQDGNLRAQEQWLFTKYDAFNRPVLSGKYGNGASRNEIQTLADGYNICYENIDLNANYGYTTSHSFPDDNLNILTVIYYDNYDCLGLQIFHNDYSFREEELPFEYGKNDNVKGQITATLTKVLPNEGIEGQNFNNEIITVNYYDKYYRVIQTVSDNHSGGMDINSNMYNFTGQLVQTKSKTITDDLNIDNIVILQEYTYDRAGRLLSTLHQINDNPAVYLSINKYTELGLLSKKLLHYQKDGSYLQKIDYIYNIRDWMTDINNVNNIGDDGFAMKLSYNEGNHPQYNGNIAQFDFVYPSFSGNYQFNYDGTNRLITSGYNGDGNYSTNYSYDKNGNIKQIGRKGMIAKNGFGSIDDITLSYKGNHLLKADDINDADHQFNGFTDKGSFGSSEYKYDENGNMIYDYNKKLIDVKYNHQNLPERLILIDEGNFNQIFYQYDAAGNKLCKQTTKNGAIVKTTRYFSTFETENGNLNFVYTAEGRAVPMEKNGFEYQYFLKDHLGNTRVVLSQSGKVLQQNSYYPFGMLMEGLNTVPDYDPYQNKYLYNGKELQTDFGLDWYDYGARFYDPALGRWFVIDPLVENNHYEWTPYSYVYNNPINLIDPNGQDSLSFNINLKMNTGKLGLKGEVGGVGLGGDYNFGGSEQSLGISFSYDTDSKHFSIGIGFSQKDILPGSYSVNVGPFSGGTSEEKETKRELTTDGPKKTEEHNYKTINEGGFSFFSTQEKEGEKPVYKVGSNAEINALIIGIGASVSFENKKSENTNNKQQNKGQETRKEELKKKHKNN